MSFEGGGRTEKEEEEEKFVLCESIGHRPLRGRCQKTGHKMDSLNYNMKNPIQNGHLGHIMPQNDGHGLEKHISERKNLLGPL